LDIETHTEGRGSMMMEAEMERCSYKPRMTRIAGNHQKQEGFFPRAFKRNMGLWTPYFRLLVSITKR